MKDYLLTLIETLADSPPLQGTLAAFSTFILEDPTTVGCALLVADGKMHYLTALIGLSLGIALGDWGLYALGRLAGSKTLKWGLISESRLRRTSAWFERNLITAIFVSRFIPGLRLPANVGAGILQASPARYLPWALVASLVWTVVTLTTISKVGEVVLPMLGAFKWPIVALLLLGVVALQRRSMRSLALADHPADQVPEARASSPFEFWHPVIFYIPVVVYYFVLAIRFRSLTLPTAANPSIYSGGMIGESKADILDLIPKHMRNFAASHVIYDRPTGKHQPEELARQAIAGMEQWNINFPIVAKPDTGQRGVGVRPVYDEQDLIRYLSEFPGGARVVLQTLAPYDHEMGIFYYRYPNAPKGSILSITHKVFPTVVGNGVETLRSLILNDPRASVMTGVFMKRHHDKLGHIIPDGEIFRLVFAGDHKQGCVFRDGMHLLTPELERRIDEISRSIPGFYFGRFDIRYRDLESMQRGENFLIVEINGASSEATHIWDPDARLIDAYRTLFEQFRILFTIADENRRAGARTLGPIQFLRDFIKYHATARNYPLAE